MFLNLPLVLVKNNSMSTFRLCGIWKRSIDFGFQSCIQESLQVLKEVPEARGRVQVGL